MGNNLGSKILSEKNDCAEASLKDDRYFLSDMVQSGVRIDISDGVRDLLVFSTDGEK